MGYNLPMNDSTRPQAADYDFKMVAPRSLEKCRDMVENALAAELRQQLGVEVVMLVHLVNVDEESSYFRFRVQELLKGEGYLRQHSAYTTYVYGRLRVARSALALYGVLMLLVLGLSLFFAFNGGYVSAVMGGALLLLLTGLFMRDLHLADHFKRELLIVLYRLFT